MKTYKLTNNVLGWIVFAIAAYTYCSTIEPTASFWDCPEFITTAAKLEVGHPPGAPFFMLFGNFFSQFASDASQIAKMINIMNALLSAGCILFLFWSVTHLAKALFCQNGEEPNMAETIACMGSGIAGALIYTWSDTFWFSAVEGEVYAFSSFFTALVFWLILKWEDNADKPHSDKWLVFIAYLVGLSIGVHLLNLLCIPAIVLVYYYKKAKNATATGSIIVLAISALIVAAVLYGVVPGIVKVGGQFELMFVNGLGMPFNTGLYIYIAVLAASLIWAIYETIKDRNKTLMNISFLLATAMLGIPFYGHGMKSFFIGVLIIAVLAAALFLMKGITSRILNTAVLCMTMIVIGYSSYAVIVVRSTANPMMDQNSPEDIFTLGEYLSREQYGDRPLFFGQTYASQPNIVNDGEGLVYETKKNGPVYQRKDKASADEKDEYRMVREKIELVYPFNQSMLFPRIYDDAHKDAYEQWLGGVTGKTVDYEIPGNGIRQVTIPTQYDNMRFFLSYQMNFMYWRYFMWNFAGRQNDLQGNGELEHGNWITGISSLDNARLGNQDMLPSDLKNNKGHNVFYCLPLLLGLLGFFWQAFRDKKSIQQFWVVFFLFFMTGIAIVLYLNQTPQQPRERDYAYAGSFYAFSIWCGLGIAAISEWIGKILKKDSKRLTSVLASAVALVPAVAVPLQMVSQTWDDHDRSDRFVCRDFGLNYLETIPQNGVIYTNGDNDTFPLWYNEDTEGKRTDVRVCNLSYLQTDWYIDQMKRPAFECSCGAKDGNHKEGCTQSSPLPISWTRLQYTSGTNEMIDVNPDIDEGLKISDLVEQVYKQDSVTAEKLWGKEPFELKNAIQKFVLHNYPEDLAPELLDMAKGLPSCLPNDKLYIRVDKEAVKKSGMMIPNDSINNGIPDKMEISLAGQNRISKSYMMMLEMLAQSNFSRPIYMSTTVGASNYGSLFYHFIQEGIAWRISPYYFPNNKPMQTVVDTEKMYNNMMNKYSYGNLKQPDLYIDETTQRMCFTHRRWFANLISNLVKEGKKDKALKALEKCATEIPSYNVPHDVASGSLEIINAYVACGKPEKAVEIIDQLEKKSREYISWYLSLNGGRFRASYMDCYQEISALASLQSIYQKLGSKYSSKASNLEKVINQHYNVFIDKCDAAGIQLQ